MTRRQFFSILGVGGLLGCVGAKGSGDYKPPWIEYEVEGLDCDLLHEYDFLTVNINGKEMVYIPSGIYGKNLPKIINPKELIINSDGYFICADKIKINNYPYDGNK